MVLTVCAGIAEFERAPIVGRASAGRDEARARGARFGRPPSLAAEQAALGRRLVEEGRPVRGILPVLLIPPARGPGLGPHLPLDAAARARPLSRRERE